MRGKGFSLLEVLVALAILALMAILVVPNLMGRAQQANLTAATDQVQSVLTECRTLAQKHGEPLRVVARPVSIQAGGGVALYIESLHMLSGSGGNSAQEPWSPPMSRQDDAPSSRSSRASTGASSANRAESRLIAQLPSAIRLSDRSPADAVSSTQVASSREPSIDESFSSEAGVADAIATSDAAESDDQSSLTVATYLPDGSVVVDGPRFLFDAKRDPASGLALKLQRWSGRLVLEPVGTGADAAGMGDEALESPERVSKPRGLP